MSTAASSAAAKLAALTDDEITALALQTVGELHRRNLDAPELLEPLLDAILRGDGLVRRLERLRTATTPTGPRP